jgi:hypothetical protein
MRVDEVWELLGVTEGVGVAVAECHWRGRSIAVLEGAGQEMRRTALRSVQAVG